jgi:glycosyltransferase involved in cell wall biosynthesis
MTERLKILHLIDSLAVGGAERFLLNLLGQLDRSQFELHVCCLNVVRGNKLQPAFQQLDLALTVLGSRHLYDLRSAWAVARYIRRHRIDIVHTHMLGPDVIGRLVGVLLQRPVFSTMQNEPRDYDRKRFDACWLERLSARRLPVHLIAVSERIRTMFLAEWQIPPARITTICNGVPMHELLAIPALPPERPPGCGPVITTIGRLSRQKAQHYVLMAAQRVVQRYPSARFLIVGEGKLEDTLKQQARELGIAHAVRFTGVRDDIPAILAQSDLFVLSSLWEGLPLSAVEAMAAARPVVLTDVGGHRELVQHGVQGLIVPPGDADALADALLCLLDDEPRRVAMGRAARQRVAHDFNIQTVAARYAAAYAAAAQRSGRG